MSSTLQKVSTSNLPSSSSELRPLSTSEIGELQEAVGSDFAAAAKAAITEEINDVWFRGMFQGHSIDRSELPEAANAAIDTLMAEKRGYGPKALKIEVDGQPVFIAATYSVAYEQFRLMAFDAEGNALGKASGVQARISWE
jgi:hypothetical protein